MQSTPLISVDQVSKWYGPRQVLMDVAFGVQPGQCVVLCGPSGCGKSTLLRCINGLEEFQSGQILLDGVDVAANADRRSRMGALAGMVFQDFNLFPHLTALENIALGPTVLRKTPRREALQRADALLNRVALRSVGDRYPHELSGGQQQRVAIARALAMDPKVMLFDEPTSSLDPEMVKEVLDVMKDLARSGMTMVCVTHEMGFARNVADQVIFLTDGCLCERAAPCDFFSNPRTPEAVRFLECVLHA
ncbi:amino acid ABC transporter ATP-binding protein [Terrarubrum flagellatum]|uniref:amino acid ABC transporter ATP-binding protein n=1 Tax=Terrirubrum flagellatum TaxID=2895980 RepID=UPI0031456628